jgi:hypothetical protein
MLTVGPLGGARAKDLKVCTIKNVDGGPLGGTDGDLGGPTINAANINGGPPRGC